eukprot:CAMPEP_0117672658 /NCGR_PEP_ID=MMETSP0804-20121206/14026_1 /TAXON_ID=1074897 /ORGANISM="Tetraselmis astigmatica, Strain CCMP880" /LENGTH=335 /DNA_ID=CAMNT_0005481283 /DNA_START=30 /DNA_END=1038 /DNA_ORIENTATION=+
MSICKGNLALCALAIAVHATVLGCGSAATARLSAASKPGLAIKDSSSSFPPKRGDEISRNSSPLPVVIWHGLGDSCCNPDSMGAVKDAIEKSLPGVFVYSINAAGSGDDDPGYFGNVNEQVEAVCGELSGMEELAGGFNAVGFSQGGQFLRAVLERCQDSSLKMKTLVTMGAQHQGVSSPPGCGDASSCKTAQSLINWGAYIGWIQKSVVPAQYYKDVDNMEQYLEASIFLADINNERPAKNSTYAAKLQELERLVLVRFTKDQTVVPRDSAWFSWWGDDGTMVGMEDTPLYKEDWIGLRALDEAGRVERMDCEGEHMQFGLDWFVENIVSPFLS